MKKQYNYFVILISLFLMTQCNMNTTKKNSFTFTPNPSGFKISRGVNISHWLSQVYGFSKRDVFFTREDVKYLDSLGYDHIRMPIDEKELWDEQGAPIPSAFDYLKNSINWCMESKLRIIVDLHIVRSYYFNAANENLHNTLWTDEKAQQHFFSLWKTLSDSLHQYPDSMVAYEILNEANSPDPEDWNKLIKKTIDVIRANEPQRVIVVGANEWQTARAFPFLKVPEGDKNIILSFHTYDPLMFTHYKASWTGFSMFNGKVQYPGQVISKADYDKFFPLVKHDGIISIKEGLKIYNAQKLEERMKPAIQKASELKLQLYCGEFGCLPTVDRSQRLQYYTDITNIFQANNIAYCSWDYKGLFGIRKWDGEKNINISTDSELINILTGKAIN